MLKANRFAHVEGCCIAQESVDILPVSRLHLIVAVTVLGRKPHNTQPVIASSINLVTS